MAHTLLEITQSILSSLNSDEVNSISDTPESLQVAECIKTSYYNMLGRYDLPEHNQLINLQSSDNINQPTLMTKPLGINRIEWIQYFDSNPMDSASQQTSQFGAYNHDLNLDINITQPWTTTSTTSNTVGTGLKTFTVASATLPVVVGQGVQVTDATNSAVSMTGIVVSYTSTTLVLNINTSAGSGTFANWTLTGSGGPLQPPGYIDVPIVDPHDFLRATTSFNLSDTNVGQYTLTIDQNTTGLPGQFNVKYKNDNQPHFCCILSNYYILFDSFDNTQDSTLQSSKSLAYAWVMPPFILSDTFVPPLDDQQYPMLLNEAKSLAWFELKQMPNQKAEQEVLRQLASLQKFKALAHKPSPFDYLPNFGRRIGTGGFAVYNRSAR
jgi:hypothetical protein